MDAFYASVEQRDNPELRGKPVIVGGNPGGRGVVAACSYEARVFGIHSAMPSAEAKRRCPHAHFVRSRFDVYRQVSKQIHQVFTEFTRQVEPLSLDEAYLDVTLTHLLGGSAVRMAREIKAVIKQRTNLVASAGVSYNKFLAKIASDFDKPDGLHCVLPDEGAEFVAALPIGRFYGVGKSTESRMHELGIQTGADLRRWSHAELRHEFGKSADYYFQVARGIDDRQVSSSRTRKSLGSETTFAVNLTQTADMLTVLERLTIAAVNDLQKRQLLGTTLTIKVRFANFNTINRGHTEANGIHSIALAHRLLPFLLERALQGHHQPSVRLLGVSISGLSDFDDKQPMQYELNY